MGVLSPLTNSANALASYAGSYAFPPLLSVSRSASLSLKNIQIGSLSIHDTDGSLTICGSPRKLDLQDEKSVYSIPHAELRVLNDLFWVRLLLFADMGFAESYMLGEVACPDITAFFKLFIQNRAYLSNGSTFTSDLAGKVAGLIRSTNTLTNARLNISAHYDISNAMFASFLSRDMTYSCPIWSSKKPVAGIEGAEKTANWQTETLEDAQMTKLDRFVDNAHIKAEDHVLEIGTGWGSFASRAVQRTGCRVTSLTLSTEQKTLAEERIAEAGLTDRIEVLLCDYRALPIPKEGGRYDKVVSIEMLEAVGKEFLNTYFECVDKLLKVDGGVAVFQCITMPETVSADRMSMLEEGQNADIVSRDTPRTSARPISSDATFSPAVISPQYHYSRPPSPPARRTRSSWIPSKT
jgi:cyclopropane-fatty-acyl-phospholipid synthase